MCKLTDKEMMEKKLDKKTWKLAFTKSGKDDMLFRYRCGIQEQKRTGMLTYMTATETV